MDTKKGMPMLVVLYAAAFVSAFNENIMNVALVDVMGEFGITSTSAQWLVTGYMAVTAVVVALMAFSMRRFGMRKLFFAASLCFVVGEVGAFVAPGYGLLLAMRLLQAVGSGAFATLMMSAVLECAPREKMGTYLSIGSAAITLGPAFAPVLSGVAVTLLGWRYVFAVPGACGLVVLLAGIPCVRDITDAGKARLDAPSLALMITGLVLFVFGLGRLALDPTVGVIASAVSLALLVVFARRQEAIDNPLLNLRPLVHNGSFALASLLVVVCMMTTFSMGVLLPLYFQSSFYMSALLAGAALLPAIVVNVLTAIAGGRVMDRFGAWPLLPMGFGFITVGQFCIVALAESLTLAPVIVASVVVYAGVGLVMSPSQTAGLSTLSRREHADGVAIMNTLLMIAASFGPSLFIGIMSKGAAMSASNGADEALSQAVGFGSAVGVAAMIAGIGLIVSLFFAYDIRQRKLEPIVLLPKEMDPAMRPAPTLRAVMRADAYVVSREATVRDVARILVQTHTTGVPIVDGEQRVVGYITDGDILRAFSAHQSPEFDLGRYVVNALDDSFDSDEAFTGRAQEILARKALSLATRHVVCFDVSMPLEDVFSQLRSKQFKKVPIVEDGRLVGTISRNDVMRYLMGVLSE